MPGVLGMNGMSFMLPRPRLVASSGSALGRQCVGVGNQAEPDPLAAAGGGAAPGGAANPVFPEACASVERSGSGDEGKLERFNASFLERAHRDVQHSLKAIGREDSASRYEALRASPGTSTRHALDSLALALSVARQAIGTGERQVSPADYDKTVRMLASLVDNVHQGQQQAAKDGWERYFGAYDAKVNNTRQLEQYRAVCRQVAQLVEQLGGHERVVERHYVEHVEPHLQAVVGRTVGGNLLASDGYSGSLADFLEQKACEARDRMLESMASLANAKRPEFAVLVLANAFKTQGQTERFLKNLLDAANGPGDTAEPRPSVSGNGLPHGAGGSGDGPAPNPPADGPDGDRIGLNDSCKNTSHNHNANTLTVDNGKLADLMTEMYRDIRAAHKAEKERLQAGLDTLCESLSGSASRATSPGSASSSGREAAVQTDRIGWQEAETQTAESLPELPPLSSPGLVQSILVGRSGASDGVSEAGGPSIPAPDDDTVPQASSSAASVAGQSAVSAEQGLSSPWVWPSVAGGAISPSERAEDGTLSAWAMPYIPSPDYDLSPDESVVSTPLPAEPRRAAPQAAEMSIAAELGWGSAGAETGGRAPSSPQAGGARPATFFPWPPRDDISRSSPNNSPNRHSVPTSPSGVILTQAGARSNPAELRRSESMQEARRTPTPSGVSRGVSVDQAALVSNPFAVHDQRVGGKAEGLSLPPRGHYQGKRWETVKPANRIITTEAGLRANPFTLHGENR